MNTANQFQLRRSRLSGLLPRTLFTVHSGNQFPRSHSVKYSFKVASDFLYLSGLHLSEALIVILGQKSYLFFDQSQDRIWGEHSSLSDESQALLQGLTCLGLDQLQSFLQDHLNDYDQIANSVGRDLKTDSILLSFISYDRKMRARRGQPLSICDSRPLVGVIRQIKSESEIEQMRQAAHRSSEVHTELMKQPLVGHSERQIANWIESGFLKRNMRWTAYETIVGSGPRSTILHAQATERQVQMGDLVLVDAGAEWNGYCSDITRVLPAGPCFTKAQRQVYAIVLDSQKKAIPAVRPGTTLQEIHRVAQGTLKDGLSNLGYSEHLKSESISDLMPHSTSHWLGMDVHDPCPYSDNNGDPLKLAEGMTLTIEPGLYFRENSIFTDFRNIGIRIEDDVLVTSSGCEVLSSVPKEIDEIEKMRSI